MSEAEKQLREHQERLDFDGVMVGVSRQALDEVLTELAELREAVDNTLVNGYEYLPSCGEKYLIDADDFDKLAALLKEQGE